MLNRLLTLGPVVIFLRTLICPPEVESAQLNMYLFGCWEFVLSWIILPKFFPIAMILMTPHWITFKSKFKQFFFFLIASSISFEKKKKNLEKFCFQNNETCNRFPDSGKQFLLHPYFLCCVKITSCSAQPCCCN